MPLLAVMLALTAVDARPTVDPIVAIAEGRILCTQPDDVDKTCNQTVTYTKASNGRYRELDRATIEGFEGLVIDAVDSAYIKNGRLCTVPSRAYFAAARVVQHAEGLTRQQEAALLRAIAAAHPFIGKEVCAAFVADGELLRMEAWVSGRRAAGLDMVARWVRKDDGYTVVGWRGPRPVSASAAD